MRVRREFAVASGVVVGAVASVQSRVNGELSIQVGDGVTAAMISFTSGFLVMSLIALSFPGVRAGVASVPARLREQRIKPWHLIGGLGGAFLVATQSASVPVIGVALFVVAAVAGQTTASLFLDRFGISPGGRKAISRSRLVAAVVAVLAVVLTASGRLGDSSFSLPVVVLVFVSGAGVAWQQSVNARVAGATGQPLSATWFNFVVGWSALVVLVGLQLATGVSEWSGLPTSPWWIYTGGLLGVSFVAISAWVIGPIGVLVFGLAQVAGSVVGALVLDVVAPTPGSEISWTTVVGALLAFAAVAIGGYGARIRTAE